MAHSELLNALIQRLYETHKYTEPELTVGIDSLMRVVEHVREEIGTYSVNFSTVVSALIGAVIGSVLTIIVSYWLGILP